MWTVLRVEAQAEGLDQDTTECGEFWDEAEATEERERLSSGTVDERVRFVVVEENVTVVYPDDEAPPWVGDREQSQRRGYEPDK